MDERLGSIEEKLDRLLALLDAKEQKKQKDRVRVKKKRDEEAAAAAILAGKLVVENLSGTMEFDARLPYDEWAYIMLEFRQGYNFLRWLMHTYLESYHCKRDPRKRMIARKGNYWKLYKKCGSESLVTPSDLFGGLNIGLRWESILDIGILRWGCTHINAVLHRVCTKERLPYVHEKHLPWNCSQANAECGAPKALEAEFWGLSARYRERLHAAVGPCGYGYIRSQKGTLSLDYSKRSMQAPETIAVFKEVLRALQDGVANRNVHDEWMDKNRLNRVVARGKERYKQSKVDAAKKKFFERLIKERNSPVVTVVRDMVACAKEEADLQKAISNSLRDEQKSPDDEKSPPESEITSVPSSPPSNSGPEAEASPQLCS